ncbi:MAG TPA: Uma2 family endonuclease [Pirellulaceae bacterium]|nr:Uma2 family endonuclease [Pirellulaceae bacterium]
MSVGLKISFDEYTEMVADGAFKALRDRRVELIRGELCEMNPPGPDHSEAVTRLNEWSTEPSARKLVRIRIQEPIGIPELESAPQPDVAWVKVREYRDRHPLPPEVLLLIEVADSSLDSDCGEKAELYAAAGIQDYWVVSLRERLIHVYRKPRGGAYSQHCTAGFGEELRPLAFPQYSLSVAELLGS